MAILKCKICGGELTINDGISVVKCDYCGNTNTLPKVNTVNNYDLFARANELRARCEFDLSERAYEKIIEASPQEAEAYWGMVLCEYGIEYVEDPKSKKRIPTCHRASFEAITANYNYQKAIEYADVVARPVYEEEARVIDAIQKEILALSYKEEKYDVFICYKETDNGGNRTEDSAIANDIYYQLTQEGYKVFYAAITLEDKLGQDYEPIIFAALNSAKVMLVIGTKTEYFNAVWVKNEWSRFLKIMKQDRTKLIFPCYKGINAYELPDELSHMQAQDMGKIGFINDVIRGIKKVIVKEKPKKETVTQVAVTQTSSSNISPTLRRAFIFIEDGNWEEANEYLEKVLDEEPENALAYLGKLLVDLKVKKQEKLSEVSQTFDNNQNYKKAYKYADKELKETLSSYNETISKRNEEKSKDEQYSSALSFLSKAISEGDYKEAGKKFSALSGWKDSSRRAKDCFDKAEAVRKDNIYTNAMTYAKSKDPAIIKQAIPLLESIPDWKDSTEILVKIPELCETAKNNSIYESAISKLNGTNLDRIKEAQKQFLSIVNWKDSKQKAELCEKRILELEEKERQKKIAREKAERERQIALAKRKKKIKRVSIISISSIVAIVTTLILLFTLILPTINFNKATDLLNAGKYDEAIKIYKDLDGFGASANKIKVIDALKVVEDGYYEAGVERLLKSDATVKISYDTAGGELNNTNTASTRSTNSANSLSLFKVTNVYANEIPAENTFTYTNENDFEGLKKPTRNGYTFRKWNLSSCSPEITKDENIVNIVFVAEWKANKYDITFSGVRKDTDFITVTYDYNYSGTTATTVTLLDGEKLNYPTNPSRVGYVFTGWYTSSSCLITRKYSFSDDITEDMTLYAGWIANDDVVTKTNNSYHKWNSVGGVLTSTNKTHNSSSTYKITATKPVSISFSYKTSSESSFDILEIKKNSTLLKTCSGSTNYDSYSVDLNTGDYLEFVYSKDSSTSSGSDCAYIKDITYSSNERITSTAKASCGTDVRFSYDATSTHTITVAYDEVVSLLELTRVGYTFDGWYYNGNKVGSGAWGFVDDVTLIPNWQANTYTVTYDANGGTVSKSSDTATYDSNFTLVTPERKGYEFIGWKANGKTYTSGIWNTDSNVNLVAEWKIIDYTLTYNLNGGEVEGNSATYTVEDTFTLNNPTKTGYAFTGWTGTDLTDKTMSVTIAKDSIGNREYTANWQANTYTVTYDANGGTVSKTEDTATFGSDFTLASVERRGYELVGWKANGKTYTSGIWNTDSNVNLVAEWKIIDYTLTYNLNGGTVEGNPATYTFTDTVTLINPMRLGYTFEGWTGTDLSDKTMTVTIAKDSIGNREYTANWIANDYTLTYDVNGGNAIENSTQSVTFGEDYTVIKPTRTGYTFVKWATSAGTIYNGGTWQTANDVTVIAEWSANTYTVNYNGNAGTPAKANDTAIYDKTFTLTTASRTGYEFVCWKYNGEEFTSGKWNLTTSITLVAEWNPIEYTITYNLDNGTSNNLNAYTIEDEITLSIPEKDGYTFVGWTGTDLFDKTMSVTISLGSIGPREYTANWVANTYQITYVDNVFGVDVTFDYNYGGAKVETIRLGNGEYLEYPTVPTRDKYIFRGWFLDANCTIPYNFNQLIYQDVYLYAGWFLMDVNDYAPLFLNACQYPSASKDYELSVARANVRYVYFVAYESGKHTITLNRYYINWGPDAVITNLTQNTLIRSFSVWTNEGYPTEFECSAGDVIALKIIQDDNFSDDVFIYFSDFTTTSLRAPITTTTYYKNHNTTTEVIFDSDYTACNPVREGYVFDGWYDEDDQKYESGLWQTTNDVVLTAKWIPNSYTVIYNSGLGVASKESQTVIMGEDTTLATATRDGYDFKGWYYNGVLIENGEWTIADNVTLEAKWELEYKTPYQVNHYKQNIEDDNYTLFEELNLLGQINQVVTPTVNTYEGFTSPSAKTVTVLEDGSVVVDYYYTRNKYQLKYVSNGGSINSTISIKYGTPLSLEIPEKDGRTFGGWFTDAGLTNRFTQSTMPAQTATLYAWWQEETKVNEFIYSGTSTATISKYIGASTAIVIPSHIAGLSVTAIASEAFLDNVTIETIVIPNTVTTISTKAFSGCCNLTSIVLPVGLTTIQEQAFFGCSSLTMVYYMGSASDWNNISIVSNFYLTNANRYYYSKEEPALNTDSTAYNGNYWYYVDGVPTPWVYENE